MNRSFVFDSNYMRKDYPRPPKKILRGGVRSLAGVISPSRFFSCLANGDIDVLRWKNEIDKYNIWRRTMPKESWKAFYRRVRKGKNEDA